MKAGDIIKGTRFGTEVEMTVTKVTQKFVWVKEKSGFEYRHSRKDGIRCSEKNGRMRGYGAMRILQHYLTD